MSPIIAYATYLLLNENRDPLKGFHDEFLRNFRSQQKVSLLLESESERVSRSKSKLRNQILLLLGTLFIFRYWEKGSAARLEKKRADIAETEFPSIVELFAVLVSAGESPSTAMLRVSERANGEIARKFAGALIDLKSGKSLSQSLEVLGAQVSSPTIRRFCDTLILAIERGSSLSDVLNRQVEEVRAAQHASLLTAAGKAEISLMIPVIFLILPISVLFALWPSYVSLGQSVV
jgi:tight adherence protein C